MATTRRPGGTPKTPRRTAPSRPASSRAGSSPAERSASTRPAPAARGRRPSDDLRTPRSIKGLAILASILVILAITIIPALRSTLNQQAEIRQLRHQIALQRENVAALQQEQQNWTDPAYVEQQARERLKFVRAGERSFTVIDGEEPPDLSGGAQMAAPERTTAGDVPWYGKLWQSMVIADTPTKAGSGQPSP
jgi:cell division protein FtsB